MTEVAAAVRLRQPRWLDVRLVGGLLLVVASMAVGARVVGSADHYVRVLVARHQLSPGEQLTAADVTVGRARLYGHSQEYVAATGALPVGYVVTRPVGAGELVPYQAIAPVAAAPAGRLVTVPVLPGHLPPDLGPGDTVDLYATAKAAGGTSPVDATPQLVLSGASVQLVDDGSRGLAAVSPTVDVVLDVPAAEVVAAVRAVQGGAIDLVRVPGGGG